MEHVYNNKYQNVIEITSSSNKSIKVWKSLLTGKGIKKHNRAIVSGEKAVLELLDNRPEIIQECIIPMRGEFTLSAIPSWLPVFRVKNELFRELDVHGTMYPLLLVKVPEFETFPGETIKDKVILLIPFQDPANVGAVIRSAAAFGIKKIMLLKEAATPFHPKSIRASGAQAFNVDYISGPSIFELRDFDMPIVALSPDGENIHNFAFPERFALLAGMEGPGLPKELQPLYKVSIPMEPFVESLNASVAISIALYEWRKKICFD